MQIILYHIHSDINDWGHYTVIRALMHCSEKVIIVLTVTWPLTTAPVIIVKSGATYADEMDVW